MRRDYTLSAMFIVMGMLVAKLSVGDTVAYPEVRDLRAEGSEFFVDHHHDWSGSTRKRRSTMMASHQNPFTSENNYAYVSAKKKDTGVLLFRHPSPALSWIGVTADSRYIVGLSNIQLDNPYQLVVFDSTGQLLAKQHVTATVACLTPEEYHGLKIRYASKFQVLQGHVCSRDGRIYIDYERMNMPRRLGSLWAQLSEHRCPSPFTPNARESVTNWVEWYNFENPAPEIVEQGGRPVAVRVNGLGGERITIPFTCEEP